MEEKNSREKIYATAKEVFYAEGYIKGTIKKIAERAQVPQGLVTYYFKTKDQLVSMILKDFYRSIQNRVDSYSELNITNSLYRQIVVSHIYYEILLSNENNCVFFKELRQKSIQIMKCSEKSLTLSTGITLKILIYLFLSRSLIFLW